MDTGRKWAAVAVGVSVVAVVVAGALGLGRDDPQPEAPVVRPVLSTSTGDRYTCDEAVAIYAALREDMGEGRITAEAGLGAMRQLSEDMMAADC